MNTAHILFHYYEKRNTFQTIIKPQQKSRNKTVVDFFRTNDTSKEEAEKEDEQSNDDEDVNNSKYDNMTKSALFMRYMNFTIPDYICDFDDTLDNICQQCDIEKKYCHQKAYKFVLTVVHKLRFLLITINRHIKTHQKK